MPYVTVEPFRVRQVHLLCRGVPGTNVDMLGVTEAHWLQAGMVVRALFMWPGWPDSYVMVGGAGFDATGNAQLVMS